MRSYKVVWRIGECGVGGVASTPDMKHLLVRCDDQHLLTLYYTSIPQISHEIKCFIFYQYLRQLREAAGGWRGMNTTQAGHLVKNLGE
jgi:hypothetical protein